MKCAKEPLPGSGAYTDVREHHDSGSDKAIREIAPSVETLGNHRIGDFLKPREVRARDEVVAHAVGGEGVGDLGVDALHDVFELVVVVNFLFRPGEALAVLAHFQSADRDAAGIDRLGGRDDDSVCLQVGEGFVGGGHVGDFVEIFDACGHHGFGVLDADLVLHGARHIDVRLDIAPGLLARDELAAVLVGIVLDDVPARCAHGEHSRPDRRG